MRVFSCSTRPEAVSVRTHSEARGAVAHGLREAAATVVSSTAWLSQNRMARSKSAFDSTGRPLQLMITSPAVQQFPFADCTTAETATVCRTTPRGVSETVNNCDICSGCSSFSCLSRPATAAVTEGSISLASVDAWGWLHRASVLPMRRHIQHLRCKTSHSWTMA